MSNRNPNQHLQEHDNPTFDLSWDYGYDGELRVAPPPSVTPVGKMAVRDMVLILSVDILIVQSISVHSGENRIITAQPQNYDSGRKFCPRIV